MIKMQFVTKHCIKCGNMRKFIKDSIRDDADICGECWDWEGKP